MFRVFSGLAIADVLVLIGATVMGWLARDELGAYRHTGLGVFAALLTCLIHAVVFTYFTASGKMMRQAITLGQLGAEPDRRIREFKRSVARLVGVGALTMIVTVAAGGAALARLDEAHAGRHGMHGLAAVLAVAANLWTFVAEARLIARNAALMDSVFAEYERNRPRSGKTSFDERQ